MKLYLDVEVWNYDVMHTCYQDGWMSCSLWLIASNVTRIVHNGNYAALIRYLKSCQYPSSKASSGRSLSKLFDSKMVRKHDNTKSLVANASIQFTIFPILLAWAEHEAQNLPAPFDESMARELKEHIVVYREAYRVMDLIKQIKYRRITTAEAKPLLTTAYSAWQLMHKQRYGVEHFTPKWAWMHSIIKRFDSHSWLFDMFYIERQHQRIRIHAEMVRNTISFEKSVLLRVSDCQVSTWLADEAQRCQLIGRRVQVVLNGEPCEMADACEVHGIKIHCDDVVCEGQAGACKSGVVRSCFAREGDVFLKLELLRYQGDGIWIHGTREEIWRVRNLRHPCAWLSVGDRALRLIF